ncbi:MAG TPA: S41 family peptidase [Blastocatellia bacterium]|nr:S41 family peptidase [Blastocatellia bacterium]
MRLKWGTSIVRISIAACLATAICMGSRVTGSAGSQAVSKLDRERAHAMLETAKSDIKRYYYDPAYHGMDVDARFKAADQRIDQATSNGEMFGIIAQALLDLNDSHTFFSPPRRAFTTQYGWQMQMVGDNCYVSAVKPGSDAEAKGVKPGDQVLSVSGFRPDRSNLWKLQYLFYSLKPVNGLRLILQSPTGQTRQVDAMARVIQGAKVVDLTNVTESSQYFRDLVNEDQLYRNRYYEMGDDALIWKMPEFDMDDEGVDGMMDKARKRKALILDLRGNPGGRVSTLLRLIGDLFDHDVTVGEPRSRKSEKPMIAKSRGSRAFGGKVLVLVDSNSASSSEMLARVIQLEKRGTVIGDRSEGAVMEAQFHFYRGGTDTQIPYGVQVTVADVIMTDGKSLEKVGVTPDDLLLPSAADLAAERDPVLAHAAELAGLKIDAEKAGTMFPIQWGNR